MIKKILSTLLVSSALFVFAATGSFADRPTFNVGATVAYGGYTASGQENEGAGTPQEIHKKDATGAYGYTSLFVEASFADRVTVGASWMTDAVVIGTLPGNNVTTALAGDAGKRWGISRGKYTEFQQTQTYANNEETIPGSEEKYTDYEYGFFDPVLNFYLLFLSSFLLFFIITFIVFCFSVNSTSALVFKSIPIAAP